MTVSAILKHKGHDVATVPPGESVAGVVSQLSTRQIGAVVVKQDGGELLGIVSERDIVHALAEHGAAALDMTAEQLMTRGVHTVTRSTTVIEAMTLMTAGRFRHLPVVENGAMLGIISIGDVVK
ncbi:MAG TPA: CBS domain-containing protein, partial [Acetobacteraceae bacterium]